MLFACATLGTATAQDFKPRYTNNIDFGLSYTGGTLRSRTDGMSDARNDYVGLQFNYIGLFHLTPAIAVGAGTGLRHLVEIDNYADDYWGGYDDQEFLSSYFAIPLYAHARFRFLNKRVSPFLATSIGYQFRVGESTDLGNSNSDRYEGSSRLSSGLLANAQAGVSIHVGKRFNIMAGPYFEYRQATANRFLSFYDGSTLSRVEINSDMNFFEAGLKVGFAF